MRRPDFFFVGHPRSGSGLLDSFLKGHPDVFMAKKELHYFGSDLDFHVPRRTIESYLAHFKGADGAMRVGEASTWYLASEVAAREIHDFAPDAHILMMLRNPVDWLHSLHSHLVFTTDEDITDFGRALAAEPDRIAGRRIPPGSHPRCALYYRGLVRYADQVRRFFEAFGRDRVLVLILDDFKADPAAVYDRVLQFLGLCTEFPGKDALLRGDKRSRNSNRVARSVRLARFINAHPQRRIVEGAVPSPVPGWGITLRALRRLNTRYAPRPPMDPELKEALAREFLPEVERLEDLLERPLDAWKPRKAAARTA